MKLYYMPGACSLAPHIVANEAGIALDLIKVDGQSKKTEGGEDFLAVNPKGYVPTLVLEDGRTLMEAQVVVQYLADQKPESGLMPPAGDMARYRAQEWLAFVSSELHKSFSPFFNPAAADEVKTSSRANLDKRLPHVDQQLAGKAYLAGDSFTAPDAYLWTILNWAKFAQLDLAPYANISKYMETVGARPAVVKSLQEEGLA